MSCTVCELELSKAAFFGKKKKGGSNVEQEDSVMLTFLPGSGEEV